MEEKSLVIKSPIVEVLPPLGTPRVMVTCVRNMIDPFSSKQTIELPVGLTIKDYVDHFFLGGWGKEYDLVVSENGITDLVTDYDRVISKPSYLTFALVPQGGGKKGNGAGKWIGTVIMVIATIALAVATYGVGLGYAVPAWVGWLGYAGMVIGAGTIAFSMASIASLAPSSSINNNDSSNSATYGWDSANNYSREGGAFPVLYGTTRVTPPCLTKFVSTNATAQTINLLYAVADHACDSLTGVEINDTPVESFSDVTLTTDRLGAPFQTVIPEFSDTIADIEVNSRVTTTYMTRRTTGNAINGFAVSLLCPRGICYMADDGSPSSHTVYFTIEYKLADATVYTTYLTSSITDATTTPIRRYYRKDNLTPGQYDIRIRLTTANPTGTRYCTDLYWNSFQEIVYDDFVYPWCTLLAVKALATESLNGSLPKVTVVASRNTVPVWTGADYEDLPATNPAWAVYDMLHNNEYGAGYPHSRIIYEDFLTWAEFCDENNYTCNIYFDTAYNFRKAIDSISTLGRGHVIQKGAKYSVIIDNPLPLPVQGFLFTPGNILENSFQEDWIPYSDRSNFIEVTYWDKDDNWSKQTVALYSSDYETTQEEPRSSSIDLVGCTSRDMAIRYGKWLLNINRYISHKITFKADIDSIACIPGDIIEVAHDVPQWGYGGRLVDATEQSLTLDREVTMSPGETYYVTIRRSVDDVRVECEVSPVTVETTTNEINLTAPLTVIPEKFDNYTFGTSEHMVKLFRVASISRASDFQRTIRAVEYNSLVYADNADIGIIENPSNLAGVYSFRAEEVYIGPDDESGTFGFSYVQLNWLGQALRWNVYIKEPGYSGWAWIASTTKPHFQVRDLLPKTTYQFSVSDTDAPGVHVATVNYSGTSAVYTEESFFEKDIGEFLMPKDYATTTTTSQFREDENLDFMPAIGTDYTDAFFEIDGNGDIQPNQ